MISRIFTHRKKAKAESEAYVRQLAFCKRCQFNRECMVTVKEKMNGAECVYSVFRRANE